MTPLLRTVQNKTALVSDEKWEASAFELSGLLAVAI